LAGRLDARCRQNRGGRGWFGLAAAGPPEPEGAESAEERGPEEIGPRTDAPKPGSKKRAGGDNRIPHQVIGPIGAGAEFGRGLG